jgi:hypothetical protein
MARLGIATGLDPVIVPANRRGTVPLLMAGTKPGHDGRKATAPSCWRLYLTGSNKTTGISRSVFFW